MTTKANILLIAPELSDRSDDLFNLVIADVSLAVSSSKFGTRTEEAQRYLAAHLLSLCGSSTSSGAGGASGSVKREKVDQVEKEYGSIGDILGDKATRYDLTVYGQRYMTLSRALVPNFLVV